MTFENMSTRFPLITLGSGLNKRKEFSFFTDSIAANKNYSVKDIIKNNIDGTESKSRDKHRTSIIQGRKNAVIGVTESLEHRIGVWKARRHVTSQVNKIDNLRRGCSLLLKQRAAATVFRWQDVPRRG